MSDGGLEQNNNENLGTSPVGEKREASRKNGSISINPDLAQALTNALDSWENLSAEVKNKKAPDQEQLDEVKKILLELKSKIKEFID
jgi:hypothetical protein